MALYLAKNLDLEAGVLRNDLSTISFLLLFAFVFIFCSNSCTQIPSTDYFEYTENKFNAVISGEIDGSEIEARLAFDPQAESEDVKILLTFSKPESLAGLNLTLFADGSSSARIGDVVVESIDLEGISAPFIHICTRQEPYSVKKFDDGSTSVTVKNSEGSFEYRFKRASYLPFKIKGNIGERHIDVTISEKTSPY